MPDGILSDRDPECTSNFWNTLLHICGVRLKMSSSRHPQTDGSSEIMNIMISNYLPCYCNCRETDWVDLLPSAEFAYNSAESEELRISPFELDFGWVPKSPLDMLSGVNTSSESVNELKTDLRLSLQDSQYSYSISRARHVANIADRYRTPNFKVGDRVWVRKELFMNAYARSQPSEEFKEKRYGPFKILQLIGKTAVKLDLSSNVKGHPVNVSFTVPYHEQPLDIGNPFPEKPVPVETPEGPGFVVEEILSHRKRGHGYQFLTLMKGAPRHEASWQPTRDFIDSDGTVTAALYDYVKAHDLPIAL